MVQHYLGTQKGSRPKLALFLPYFVGDRFLSRDGPHVVCAVVYINRERHQLKGHFKWSYLQDKRIRFYLLLQYQVPKFQTGKLQHPRSEWRRCDRGVFLEKS